MKIEDIILIITSLIALGLMIYMVVQLSKQRSPEFITYKDFIDYTFQNFSILIAIIGLNVGNTVALWYKIGRLEGSGPRKGRKAPQE